MNEATEAFWLYVDREWGLLDETEVARLLDTDPASLPVDRRLLGVRLGREVMYPGFQFDRDSGQVLDVIPQLVAVAQELDMDDEDLVFWLCGSSGQFGGDRPVDHLDEPGVVLEGLRHSGSVGL